MRFRRLNRRRAHAGGYFWLPCPLCGQMFGGHEWPERDGIAVGIPTDRTGVVAAICPDCARAGRGT